MNTSLAYAPEDVRPEIIAEVERIRALLDAYRDKRPPPAPPRRRASNPFLRLQRAFGLSDFERDVVALTAAVELDGEIGSAVARLQCLTDPRPSFGLALAVLPDGHWDALAPGRPLRHWRLIELGGGPTLATRAVAQDEHVLHWLTGVSATDAALAALIRPQSEMELTGAQQELADELAEIAGALTGGVLIRLAGDDADARLGVAHRIAAVFGLTPLVLRDDVAIDDVPRIARLVDRAALLHRQLPVVIGDRIADQIQTRLVIALGDGADTPGRTTVRREVRLPEPADQRAIWSRALARPDLANTVEELAAHYRLSARTVYALAAEYAAGDQTPERLRRLVRDRARSGLDGLAERIETYAGWDDLVLPPGQIALLRDLATQVRHRTTVYERWGFGERANRGLGVTALFSGESGTGKTMAAEVIAGDLGLDLYRIDLSATVSKYIGETEKNLRHVFDAAEGSGAVLLFDEADALFGKRSEVRDAHDRYANLEVAYLLQRMESYRGLAILTTNLRSNVDKAFLRRLRFVVQFPFPDQTLRAQIWRRAFPPRTPLRDLDPDALARLQVSGGSIRAIALGAAFVAAGSGSPVTAKHILHAAGVEYAKAERNLSSAETAELDR
jgi:vesicle-fusing ATPase